MSQRRTLTYAILALILILCVDYRNIKGVGHVMAANNPIVGYTEDGMKYKVNEDGKSVSIVEYTGEQEGSLIIPAVVNEGGKKLSVTIIEEGAFLECSGFTGDLIIPDSVVKIGRYAFSECKGFKGNLVISDNVTYIGEGAFHNCSGFTGELKFPLKLEFIGAKAFFGCKGFTGSLSFPNTVTDIEGSAFWGCGGFDGELKLPDSIHGIEYGTFYGCSHLTGDLVIPAGVKYIGKGAFWNCLGFGGTLTVPASVEEIATYAFSGCWSLRHVKNFSEIDIPVSDLPDIEGKRNWVNDATGEVERENLSTGSYSHVILLYGVSIDYPHGNSYSDKVETCRGENVQLTAVLSPSDADYTEILWESEDDTVAKVDQTGMVTAIKDGSTYINVYVKSDYGEYTAKIRVIVRTRVNEIILDQSEISLKEGEIKKIVATALPEDATDKSLVWLSADTMIARVDKDGNVTAVGQGKTVISAYAQDNLNLVSGVSASCTVVVSAGDEHSDEDIQTTHECGKNLTWKIDADGVLTISGTGEMKNYDISQEMLTTAPWAKYDVKSVVIGSGVTSIGNCAFFGCSSLAGELTIPNTVASIGENAFNSCDSITSLIIPNSVTKIGSGAFNACSGLTGSLTIPGSVTYIEDYAFWGCEGLTADLILSEGVTHIGANAFEKCSNIEQVTIPQSVIALGYMQGDRVGEILTGYSIFNDCVKLAKVTNNSAEYCDLNYTQTGAIWVDAKNTSQQVWGIAKGVAIRSDATENGGVGDINGDGKVDAKDRMYLARYLAGWDGYTLLDEKVADVNSDSKVDAKDRMYLARYLAGWDGYSLKSTGNQ
ncbi:MAG: leucine-rich repeat protein [Lachnospiraceae bacterium]|nr:leucine-rich repeat protein [Lachnospiraceae bacterium]